jgi:aspartyl-tRNA(Asn)/glutamyl-tRNA(Gln) amidotransferase subunit C
MDTTMHKAVCIIAGSCPARRLGLQENPEQFVSLTKDQVQHIAILARLKLADSEFDDVVDKLSRIVDFVDQLQAAPTDDVLPMAHPLNMTQRLRVDEVTEPDERDDIQKNAPSTENGYYLVPKVIE